MEHRRPPGEDHKTVVPSNNQPRTELTKPFSLDELATGLSLLKPAKAAGLDDSDSDSDVYFATTSNIYKHN